MKKYIAELLGTFALVFCGTGAIVINSITGAITHPGIAIAFGLIVTIMIYALGPVSGAHMNPAVSIAFSGLKKLNGKDLLGYTITQLIGAFAASFLLLYLFPESQTMGETLPFGTWQQSFILEIFLTFLLMLVILLVSENKETNTYTGFIVGGTVWLEALFAGPITGASMNPARSIAPAVVSGNVQHLWVYIAAPIIGALLATVVWKYFSKEE